MHSDEGWPELHFETLQPTAETLHLWTQIVGKVRLASTPWLNHSWHVPLYVGATGLTTGLIPHGPLGFDLTFDLLQGALVMRVTDGGRAELPLASGTVADFNHALLDSLSRLGVAVAIHGAPNEIPNPRPFAQDFQLRPFDLEVAQTFWRALVRIDHVFNRFRTSFLGKSSPVHFFWGSFDLALTRFSGRRAPLHPGGIPSLPDAVAREAYSHEVSSCGFWPGGGEVPEPCFYAYAYPTPEGFSTAQILPEAARFEPSLGEFLLPYRDVRAAPDPEAGLTTFLQSTYDAAADLAGWDRAGLECAEGQPRVVRRVN